MVHWAMLDHDSARMVFLFDFNGALGMIKGDSYTGESFVVVRSATVWKEWNMTVNFDEYRSGTVGGACFLWRGEESCKKILSV